MVRDAKDPKVLLIATGSELELVLKAAEELEAKGVAARVVSMPCMELFEEQSAEYKESVLPRSIRARVTVEAGSTFGWGKYVGLDGETVGLDTFGASAPPTILFPEFGFTVENVVAKALASMEKAK